jgi:hypothetical protein
MMYLDLDELDEAFAGRWFWSAKRPALARFRRSNYHGNPEVPLDTAVRDLVQERTGRRPSGPVRLLTNLSYFGYCFNPLSIYYCFDSEDSRVETIVAEVSNTPWGEKHCYILSDDINTGDEKTRRFSITKKLHVSPFMGMDMRYDWLLTTPESDLVVRINNKAGEASLFGATLKLKRSEMSGPALARVLFSYPLMTFRVIAGIHWQALRLWLKGCPLVAHPDKSEPVGVGR